MWIIWVLLNYINCILEVLVDVIVQQGLEQIEDNDQNNQNNQHQNHLNSPFCKLECCLHKRPFLSWYVATVAQVYSVCRYIYVAHLHCHFTVIRSHKQRDLNAVTSCTTVLNFFFFWNSDIFHTQWRSQSKHNNNLLLLHP